MKKVGIIGGAGFIGSYITKTFLQNGFEVKVSTTDITKQEKYRHLTELEHSGHLYITELNVENKNLLQQFAQDCDIIIHGGTPFLLDAKDPKTELFDTTIKGTENLLNVINYMPSVEKVVFIASVATYNSNFPLLPEGKELTDMIDENDEKCMSKEGNPYGQAKYIANQVVEEFIGSHPELHFEISSVSPVMVFGKSLSSREGSTSTDMQYQFKNKHAHNDFIQFLYDTDAFCAIVDVRDVAEAVYKTAIAKGQHGKNYLLSSETWKVSDVNLMLNGLEPKNKPVIVYKNDLAKADLAMQFRPVKETLNWYANVKKSFKSDPIQAQG